MAAKPRRFPDSAIALLIISVCVMAYWYSIPAIGHGRAQRRPSDLANLHNISIAIQCFASTNDGQLPPQSHGPHDVSWRVALLPLLDHAAMYRAYHRDKPWNDPANQEFAQTKIPAFICPENPTPRDAQGRYYTAYALLTGSGTAYDQPTPQKLEELPNGLTSTILAVEASGANIVWNEPRDLDVAQDRILVGPRNEPIRTVGGWVSRQHKDYVNVVFADGSTRTLSLTIDPEVLKAMTAAESADHPKDKRIP
jgi:prepilin-type processing-associated H-X9-DG protein